MDFFKENLGNIQGGYEVLLLVVDLKTGQPITRQFVKEIPITKEVIVQVEQLAKKDGFRPHAEPIFRTYALLAGVEDNNNNNIEENSLSDEEDSVPDVLHAEESDSDSESEEEEEMLAFIRSEGQSKHLFQGSYSRWRSHSRAIAQIRKSPCAENHIEANFSGPNI